ncbi:MAG: UDP-N-acetylmuramoyl-tripeptide--D-alanyl-D-alanine ligase [Actinomycetota bacterium]|nr:UDP-N-acetylmuramoyl-tripeptide--D-alanyl-D-alanine ligase [Actinomycetota bacterium]
MIPLPLSEIAATVRARVEGADPAEVVSAQVEVDSRLVEPGGVFVALRGEHQDGHDHAADAVRRGAVAVVCDRPLPGLPCLVVGDPLVALQSLARAVFLYDVPPLTFGITGSSGKTSTKDLMAQVLGAWAPTLAPRESFNNEVGLPLTLLRRELDTRGAVLEYSARGEGHIAFLCSIAAPHVAVVLNVGSAHLGEFGSRSAIARAKGELVERALSMAVLNADDPHVMSMAGRRAPDAELHTFGLGADAEYRAEDVDVDADGRATFTLVGPPNRVGGASAPVHLQVRGAHQVPNAVAVAAAAMSMGLFPSVARVAALLSGATAASHWRMEVSQRPDGVTIVNDAYNANPESMRAAIDTLMVMARHRQRRTFAVLGQMAELGAEEEREHRALGEFAAERGVDRVVVVGPAAAAVQAGAGDAVAVRVGSQAEALALLARELRAGDIVLVKASRSARFEVLAEALLEVPA